MTLQKKRDESSYDAVPQYLPGLLIDTILKILDELDEPYHIKPGVSGIRGYSPKIMAAICILKEAEKKTFRGIAAHLEGHKDLQKKLGLIIGNTPKKSTIHRAFSMIPESYPNMIHVRIVAEIKIAHAAAGDSTGISEKRYEKWLDYRTDKVKTRHGWQKLHAIIDVKTRVILAYFITNSRVSDISALYTMLGSLVPHIGEDGPDFCLDAAYLARNMCEMIRQLGADPYIWPKKNTIHNAKGSQAWRDMIDKYQNEPSDFRAHYHQRSIIESVFGAYKTTYGSYVRCRRPDNKRREIAMCVICHSVDMVTRSRIDDGRLTSQMLGEMYA